MLRYKGVNIMNISVPSYVAGPLLLASLFALCAFTVIGAKTLLDFIRSMLRKKSRPPEKAAKRIPAPRRQPRTLKSIEINPDDVDRIYVRKSS